MPIRLIAKIKEVVVEQYLIDRVAEAFPTTMCLKYEVRRNEPDRILIMPEGRTVFVETKRPGKDLRSGQVRAFKRLNDLGHEAYMANTRELVDELIEFLKKPKRGNNGNAYFR